ncbi:MAG: hypothetical protein V7607_2971 [Solirubrobacteraceae bacterium]
MTNANVRDVSIGVLRHGRSRGVAAVLAALALAATTGCGSEARDLFLVTRSGDVPGARLTLRITDDGRASCDRRPLVEITSAQLIAAHESARDLEDPAKAQLRLAPGPQPVFSYRVRTEEGGVAWSDDSARQPAVLFKLAKLTRDVAKGPCHLAR